MLHITIFCISEQTRSMLAVMLIGASVVFANAMTILQISISAKRMFTTIAAWQLTTKTGDRTNHELVI